MADLGNFDAHDVDPASPFEALPAGKYVAIVTASEMKRTKAGNGQYLQLEFEVVEGQYAHRKLWARLTLDHPNALTVQIARAQLSALCRAVGVMRPRDSVELHNLPVLVTVKCKKREDNGDIVNEVAGFEKREAKPAQAQFTRDAVPPWRRQ